MLCGPVLTSSLGNTEALKPTGFTAAYVRGSPDPILIWFFHVS